MASSRNLFRFFHFVFPSDRFNEMKKYEWETFFYHSFILSFLHSIAHNYHYFVCSAVPIQFL